MNLNICCILIILLNYSDCARILAVIPHVGISHNILGSKLVKGLAQAGHDVTFITAYPIKDIPKNVKITEIYLDGLIERGLESVNQTAMNGFNMNDDGFLAMMVKLSELFVKFTNLTLTHPKVKTLIKSNQKFDAVLVEQFCNDGLKVFAHYYDAPLIILSSMGANSWVNPLVGNPQEISYHSHIFMGDFSKDLSLINRGKNLFMFVVEYLLAHYYIFPKQEHVMHAAFPDSPSLNDLQRNVSLVLLNSHTSLFNALPLVPNMIEIGGYFIDAPKALPQDLQQFLDSAEHGVVYFSMGSNLKSKNLPLEKKRIILNVFGRLKQKVLMKFEEDFAGKSDNVMIRSWLPQQDILAHKNIKLFITHGGLLSTTETIYHGVPILAIPVFGDQSSNADRAVNAGYGLKLEYTDPDFTEERLGHLINELLTNPIYKENAERRTKLYHDRPMKPMQTAIYWVEYVIKTKGAPHLRVAGLKLPWYKYYLFDVYGAILFILWVGFYCVKKFIKLIFNNNKKCISISGKKSKKQKSN